MATALAPRMEKAFSMAPALVESASPGLSGVDMPMAPLKSEHGDEGAAPGPGRGKHVAEPVQDRGPNFVRKIVHATQGTETKGQIKAGSEVLSRRGGSGPKLCLTQV